MKPWPIPSESVLVVIPTIMHSGTHLMKNVFANFKGIGPNFDQPFTPPNFPRDYKVVAHLTDANRELYQLVQSYPVVTPVRHPVKVLESFRRRGLLESYFLEQWRNLKRIHEFEPCYVHVDRRGRRDNDLRVAGKRIGRQLHCEWPLLTVKHTHNYAVTPERVADIPPEVMDIYEETLH